MTEPNVSPEEVVREALREPYEVRGDGGVSRKAVADALTALDTLIAERERLREALREIDRHSAWYAKRVAPRVLQHKEQAGEG